MIVACAMWGLSPLFYAQLSHVPAGEVLAHRTLWSLLLFIVILIFQRRLAALPRAIGTGRRFGIILLASTMIAVNWGLFIWSVQVGRVTETSLGYYIFPLVAVLFGMVFFGERLKGAQMLAVGLASCAVVVLTIGLGAAPWIALILAVTFAFYGVLKKRLDTGPVVSVAAEVLVLAPVALLWLAYTWPASDAWLTPRSLIFLVLSGPMTAGPLMLFSYATRRASMATVGLVQYLNPTLQFFCAVVVFAEPFTRWHAIAFPLIWVALAVYSVSTLRTASKAKRDAAVPG